MYPGSQASYISEESLCQISEDCTETVRRDLIEIHYTKAGNESLKQERP
jgi:hypothetical protein